jgi:hypothetical protein
MNEAQAAVNGMLADETGTHMISAALYKRQRVRLLAATHGKCAYCEIRLAPGQRKGDVEHYRPKGRARGIDGKVVKIRRNGALVSHPGYYWLAYDYMNLLPACSACNRRAIDASSSMLTGKSDIFPTLDGRWASRPEEITSEQPALLNPWMAADDPAEHLLFDPKTGLVIGLTERGKITIDVLGLNRDGLPEQRKQACITLRMALTTGTSDAVRGRSDAEPEIETLVRSVRSGYAEFAAICRAEMGYVRRRLQDALNRWMNDSNETVRTLPTPS